MNLEISTEYPIILFPLCVASGLLYALLLYYRDSRYDELSKFIRNTLFALRTVLVTILAFFLLNPVINSRVKKNEKPALLFIVDNSESIKYQADTTILQNQLFPQLVEMKRNLEEDYTVRSYVFGESFREKEIPDFSDKITDYSQLFNQLVSNYSNRNLGSVVLLSDGNYNRGINPYYLVNEINAPFYTIPLGDSVVQPDIAITRISTNDLAFINDEFPVRISIMADKMQNQKVRMEVSNNQKLVYVDSLLINANNQFFEKDLTITATDTGLQNYRIKLTGELAERNVKNNTKEFVIEILDSRNKILLLYDSPHPDVAAISSAVKSNKNLEIETFSMQQFENEVNNYNLVIAHQLPSYTNRDASIFENARKLGIPLLYIVGQNTQVAALYNLTGSNIKMPNRIQFEEIYPSYNPQFATFTIDDELQALFPELPPLLCPFADYTVAPGTEILFTQKIRNLDTDKPLLVFNTKAESNTGIIFGEGLWRWKVYDFKENGSDYLFNDLMNKIIQYLSLKVKKERFYVQVPKVSNENENLVFNAGLYTRNYELVNTPEVQLEITDENGNEFPYVFVKNEDVYQINTGKFPPGNYRYKANVEFADEQFTKTGRFSVVSINAEYQDNTANLALLNQIALLSGGELVSPDQINTLKDKIRQNASINPSTYTEVNTFDLINLKWIFFVLLALVSLEWFLRKYFGNI